MAASLQTDSPSEECSALNSVIMDGNRKRLQLRNILRKEIEALRSTLDSFNTGSVPLLDQQVPYLSQMLNSSDTTMRLTVRGLTESGETLREITVNLNQTSTPINRHQEETLGWAQLVHYLLHSRGRLTKSKSVLKMCSTNGDFRTSEPFQLKEEKAEYLATSKDLRECTKMRSLDCSYDPEWALRILQIVAPNIEELRLDHVGPAHLQILGTMPRLKRLRIWSCHDAIAGDDFCPVRWPEKAAAQKNKFTYDLKDPTKAWQFEDVPLINVGVVALHIWLPHHIALPFIGQHCRTLRELTLEVDLPHQYYDHGQSWKWGGSPYVPEQLGELVKRYQFDMLRSIRLFYTSKHAGANHLCQAQLQAVRKAIAKTMGTRVVVYCNSCG